MNTLIEELKQLIIASLDLEDISPADIDASKPLFGDGLGLDSIDALELGVAIQKKYHVKLDANSAETRQHFYSVENLAKFIQSQQQP
ncbi:MAG: phosphopantetheine-binding protein [Gammaproteobacteria bacterium]|jgi:acyl carrier protein|nr:phosphopantetheine-binding protein [Gammaproteobacteria bacterium]